MQGQLELYTRLLIDERSVRAERIVICSQNDTVTSYGAQDLEPLARQILQRLDCAAVIVAEPLHPFSAYLLSRSSHTTTALMPRDSESRSSLHDIPLIRRLGKQETLNAVCDALSKRKGCIVEGIGIVSKGTLTLEQAYIAWSSLFHATTVKYFEDILAGGPLSDHEKDFLKYYRKDYLKPFATNSFSSFRPTPLPSMAIIDEMKCAGQTTVQLGLVDSFFGNISYLHDASLYISQTSARLDQLAGQIDLVPFDDSSTASMTASSELPAHRAIIEATGCKAILHGHPRFSVIMSFFATRDEKNEIDWVDTFPVVDGEGGVGGLAENLSKAFSLTGAKAIIVRGHWAFTISNTGFGEALSTLTTVEQRCREICFLRLAEMYYF